MLWRLALPCALAGILTADAASGRSATQGAAQVYVTVADQQGRPVTGLTAADFFVRIDDAVQEVVAATRATGPASVILLTDRLGTTADYRAGDLQRALEGFLGVLGTADPRSQFALTTFDGIVLQVAPFGASPGLVDRALNRLTVSGNDAPLVDALTDACRTAARAPTPRRAILLVFAAFRADRGNPRPDLTEDACRRSGASLWTLEARASDGRNYPNPAREMVVDEVSRSSGGLHELVTTSGQLTGLASVMAGLIASQYVVTYGPGGGAPDSRLTVGVRREHVIVLAPTWLDR